MQKVLFVIPKEMMENGIYSNYIKIMQKMNYEVQIITDFKQEIKINFQRYLINISNNLFSLTNFIAYKKIKRIIKNNNFEIIICYGQIYGILSRLVKDTKTQIIYIVDEFSSNKLICKIEKILALKTKIIILTNKNDYIYALKNLNIKIIRFVNGIGVNFNRKIIKKKNKTYTFFSSGEFNKSENQIQQLESMIWIIKKYPQTKLIMSGNGKLKEYYENIIEKYDLNQNVKIVDNNPEEKCDCFISTRKKNGFGSKIIKMMFLNIPILAFETEKTKEILDKENLFNNSEQLIKKMFEYIENENNYQDYQDLEKYKLENVLNISEKIYKEINSKK